MFAKIHWFFLRGDITFGYVVLYSILRKDVYTPNLWSLVGKAGYVKIFLFS